MINIEEALKALTIEEKAKLCSGANFWLSHSVERLNIPSLRVSDGPHGLRKLPDQSHLWTRHTVQSVCFPTASALASSWDRNLLFRIGQALGDEAAALDVDIILGPGMNIKRTPLCGRNFEYFSEDPFLTGEMAGEMVKGIQSRGVGACVKHFACNNQETERMTISVEVEERAFHELYLKAFERVIKKANPWSIMCAYNKINGTWCSENKELLSEILRENWGYEGLVISDWAAVVNPGKALKAGLDLEMPGTGGISAAALLKALEKGEITREDMDRAVRTLLLTLNKALENKTEKKSFDPEAHHQLARMMAGESIVLLKNDNQLLPLDKEKIKTAAVIGAFARTPRFQGGGSSHVEVLKVENALDNLKALAPDIQFTYAPAYDPENPEDDSLLIEGIQAAEGKDCALIFVGLPPAYEFEGADRPHMDMPPVHNCLVEEVLKVNKNCVVILINGSAVTIGGWSREVPALVEAWLGGQAAGGAIADMLSGKTGPSGKLAETFPLALEHTPGYLDFPGREDKVRYGEGIYVGYRFYDKRKLPVAFPFGHGLTYTSFEYSSPEINKNKIREGQGVSISFTLKNTGKVKGKEIVQIYVKDKSHQSFRPEKELKEFTKVELAPGEAQKVTLFLEPEAFRFYAPEKNEWVTPEGEYEILIASSAERIELTLPLQIETGEKKQFTLQSWISEIAAFPGGKERLTALARSEAVAGILPGLTFDELFQGGNIPLSRLMNLSGGIFTLPMLQQVVDDLNR